MLPAKTKLGIIKRKSLTRTDANLLVRVAIRARRVSRRFSESRHNRWHSRR